MLEKEQSLVRTKKKGRAMVSKQWEQEQEQQQQQQTGAIAAPETAFDLNDPACMEEKKESSG